MSKRRNRTGAPNLPRETLERARRQAGVPATEPEEEVELVDSAGEVETEVNEVPEPAPVPRRVAEPAPRPAAPAPRRVAESRATSASRSATAARRGRGVRPVTANGKRELDHDQIASILEHPTKFVSDEEMKTEYGYVMQELRQVGMVAAGMFVVLVALAYLIPG